MRNLKRILTIALAAVMLVAAMAVCVSAAGTKFIDVNAKDEYLYKAVGLLEGLGITKGTSDTTFGTNEAVTREQMAAFVYRLMKAGKSLEGGENNTPFEDLYDDTYYGMISWASNQGIIKGISETEFDPDGGITLQDAYTMLVRALGYEKDTPLGYPYDYINIAEEKGVTLGEGLPSKVGYTSKLTRGNVAVLLYNAFYADMGEKVKVQKEKSIGNGAKWVLETVEEAPKLCEKVYEVVEQTFQVVETTHYAFNESASSNTYKPTEDTNGENTLFLVAVEKNPKVDSFYTTIDALGLPGKADNYIMAEMTVYYKYDDKEKDITDILFAESHMDMQTANSATYGSLPSSGLNNDSETYYNPSGNNWNKMDGSMVVAGKTLYFFDAPYSFMTPSYTGCENDEDRYDARNEDSTKLIELKCLDADNGLYTYYVTDDRFGTNDKDAKLAKKFSQVRTKGVYKMDIYDPDGDGRYEYMWYKPATFGKIIMDDDYEFKGLVKEETKDTEAGALSTMPVIYGNGAIISGVAFNDEDFVVAYVSPYANYIDVFGVATAQKGTITSFSAPTGTIKLGNKDIRVCYSYLFVEHFDYVGGLYESDNGHLIDASSARADSNLLFPFFRTAKCLGTEVIAYTYNQNYNNLMYYELASSVESNASKYSGENLLIPIASETRATYNEKLDVIQYLKVLIGGEEKYVPVDVDECYPAPKYQKATGVYSFANSEVDQNNKEYYVYFNKLCTYEVDKNGNYAIKSLFHGKDQNGKWDHVDLVITDKFFNEKKTIQVGNDLGIKGKGEEVTLKYRSGRYALLDKAGYEMFGSYGSNDYADEWFDEAYVDGDTVFMIRTITDEDEDGEKENNITTYTGLTFPGSTVTPLTNVQYIIENAGASKNRTNLVFFYGEVEGKLEFESGVSKTGYRVVKSATPVKVDEKEYRYSYDLFNISTGTLEEGILGATMKKTGEEIARVEPLTSGNIVKLNDAGKVVDDLAEVIDTINVDNNQNLVKFTDIVLSDNTILMETIREGDSSKVLKGYSLFEIAEDVEISLIKFGEKNNFETAEISVLDLAELDNGNNDLKALNSKYVDPKTDKLVTKHAEFIKAYIDFNEKKVQNDTPVVETIVVIVNDGEDTNLLDLE